MMMCLHIQWWKEHVTSIDIQKNSVLHPNCCLTFPYWTPNASEYLGGGFKDFLFLPLPGEMIQFD